MEKKDREIWLRVKSEQVSFAGDLKMLSELPIFKKIIEGMVDKKLEMLRIIDNPASPKEQIEEARNKRMAIQWFIESFMTTIHSGERAAEEVKKYQEFEAKKDNKGVAS